MNILRGVNLLCGLPLDIEANPEIVKNIKNEFLINSMNLVDYEMSMANTQKSHEVPKQLENGEKLPTLFLVKDNKE